MQSIQLAPMQELTDSFFMNSYQQVFGGFTQMMMPYILADSKSPKKPHWLKKQFQQVDKSIDVIPQLLSNDANELVKIANFLFDIGYEHTNLNLGCPFPFVTKKMRGSGLLPHPGKIQELLDYTMQHIKGKLSLKVRLGFTDKKEILTLIDIFNNYPIYQIIVHPRTASQRYSGQADKDYFFDILPKINMPVIYNGDILRKEQTEDFKNIFGIMIGRGAFINPFITNQIKGIEFSENEKREKYKQLYFLLYEHYKNKVLNEKGFLQRMKALWFYFSQSFENSKKNMNSIKTTKNIRDFDAVTNKILNNSAFVF